MTSDAPTEKVAEFDDAQFIHEAGTFRISDVTILDNRLGTIAMLAHLQGQDGAARKLLQVHDMLMALIAFMVKESGQGTPLGEFRVEKLGE